MYAQVIAEADALAQYRDARDAQNVLPLNGGGTA